MHLTQARSCFCEDMAKVAGALSTNISSITYNTEVSHGRQTHVWLLWWQAALHTHSMTLNIFMTMAASLPANTYRELSLPARRCQISSCFLPLIEVRPLIEIRPLIEVRSLIEVRPPIIALVLVKPWPPLVTLLLLILVWLPVIARILLLLWLLTVVRSATKRLPLWRSKVVPWWWPSKPAEAWLACNNVIGKYCTCLHKA